MKSIPVVQHLGSNKVRLLLGAGADKEGTGGCPPLFVAAFGGHLEVVSALIDARVNVARKMNDISALTLATHHGHLDIVGMLSQAQGCEHEEPTQPKPKRQRIM